MQAAKLVLIQREYLGNELLAGVDEAALVALVLLEPGLRIRLKILGSESDLLKNRIWIRPQRKTGKNRIRSSRKLDPNPTLEKKTVPVPT